MVSFSLATAPKLNPFKQQLPYYMYERWLKGFQFLLAAWEESGISVWQSPGRSQTGPTSLRPTSCYQGTFRSPVQSIHRLHGPHGSIYLRFFWRRTRDLVSNPSPSGGRGRLAPLEQASQTQWTILKMEAHKSKRKHSVSSSWCV